MTERYNGWTNYETWLASLWLDNDQSSYEEWRDRAQECLDSNAASRHWSREEMAAQELSRCLKEQAEENLDGWLDGKTSGIFNDLLAAAMSEINWLEIAENMILDLEPSN